MRRAFWVLLVLAAAPAAVAEDAPRPIDPFLGRFAGGAEVRDPEAPIPRQSEVEIVPTESGFRLTWTTISFDASGQGALKINSASEEFQRTADPNVFHVAPDAAPLEGEPVKWARIAGDTLFVTIMTVGADGRGDVATWARTVRDGRMSLVFTRFEDGELVRRVEGELIAVDILNEPE